MSKISVVINTYNEEVNLPKALASVKSLADEIIVVDTKSEDKTVEIAEKAGAKVYEYKKVGYVEPVRNYAISRASGDWILILDADEEIRPRLRKRLKNIAAKPKADYYRLPRKNMIFGKWMKHTLWWPDYQIRFFKKGKVSWSEVIHSVPMTTGKGIDLSPREDFSIFHQNYVDLEQYLERMNRYTTIQASGLINSDYKFIWKDLVKKPLTEFTRRYLEGQGYKDGLHGLALSLLQAFSEVVLYLKVWQKEKFLEQTISLNEVEEEFGKGGKEVSWWIEENIIKEKGFTKSLKIRLKRKLSGKNG